MFSNRFPIHNWVELGEAKRTFEAHKHDWISTVNFHIYPVHERYRSWKQFLDHAYWSVELIQWEHGREVRVPS